jgi:hypothetical protein
VRTIPPLDQEEDGINRPGRQSCRLAESTPSIAVLGGVALQRTDYVQSIFLLSPQTVSAAMAGVELKLFRFDRSNVNIATRVFPGISDLGRMYIALDSSYFVKLFGKLSWNVTSYGNWDTRAPARFSGSDYGATSGLSLSFGNK